MPLNIPTFLTRLGSSVVFVAVMLTGLLWNEWSFLALVCIINVLCLGDYFRLLRKIYAQAYWPVWLGVGMHVLALVGILYGASLWTLTTDSYHTTYGIIYTDIVAYANLTYVIFLIALMPVLFILAGVLSKKKYHQSVFRALIGLLYISMPMLFLFFMYKTGPYIPLMLICMIWSNDTMAYLVGSFFGKTPFSSISPKKTWEGTIGGALVTIIAVAITGYCLHSYRIIDWIAIALCATIAGTLGDLLESKLKRMADVKDSGTLMPGHGGALDRFDSLVVAIPFAFVYVVFFMH